MSGRTPNMNDSRRPDPSLRDQIIAELLSSLAQNDLFEASSVKALSALAESGGISSADRIIAVLTSVTEE
jgi:hypothetical protein